MMKVLRGSQQARLSEIHQGRQVAQAAVSRALRDMDFLVGVERTDPGTPLLLLQLQMAAAILCKRFTPSKDVFATGTTIETRARNHERKQQLESLLEQIRAL